MLHKKIITIFIIYLDINTDTNEEPCKILFIGNSYFNWYNLPGLFENLTDNAEKDVFVDQYCKNGLSLYDQANRVNTEAKINQNSWDYVVLIGGGVETAYPEE